MSGIISSIDTSVEPEHYWIIFRIIATLEEPVKEMFGIANI
jgi:hypothetical protein